MKRKYTKSALLLLDIQNDYFYKGKMEFNGSYEAASKAKNILDIFRKKRRPVIHIQHVAVHKNASSFISGTYGAEIYDEVKPLEGETIIIKNNPNSFIKTVLFDHLKNNQIENLTIVGMMDNMTNDPTVCTAKDLGFNVQLIESTTAVIV